MDLADLESGSSGPGGGSGGGGSSLRIPLSLLASTSLASVGRLRVLIVGDAGVGKSCIAQRIAGKSVEEVKIMTNLSSTTGCATECKLYQYRGGVGSLPATAAAAASSHGFAMGNGSGSAHLHSGSSLQHRSSGAISSSSLVGGGLSLSAPAAGASSAAPLVFIELWDVSGHRKYAPSRSVFFNSVNALILVFDLMNRKSYENIRKWIKEVVRIDKERGIEETFGYESNGDSGMGVSGPALRSSSPKHSPMLHPSQSPPLLASGLGSSVMSPSLGPSSAAAAAAASASVSPLAALSSALGNLPVLLIGNKLDEYRHKQNEQGSYESVKDYGLDSIYLSALDPKEDFSSLDRFFDRALQRRMYRSTPDSARASAAAAAASASSQSRRYAASAASSYGHALAAIPASPGIDGEQAGMNHRRMAPFVPRPSFSGTSGGGPPSFSITDSSGAGARRGSSAEWGAQGGGHASYAQHRSGPNAAGTSRGGEFVPPPIRTLADFTSIEVEGSPASSGTSPDVLSPSTSPAGRDGSFGAQFDFPASASVGRSASRESQLKSAAFASSAQSLLGHMGATSGAGSLPANTALHALTQQSFGQTQQQRSSRW